MLSRDGSGWESKDSSRHDMDALGCVATCLHPVTQFSKHGKPAYIQALGEKKSFFNPVANLATFAHLPYFGDDFSYCTTGGSPRLFNCFDRTACVVQQNFYNLSYLSYRR